MKRTPFFSGTDQPSRHGVYQRRRPAFNHLSNQEPKNKVSYALFDGVWRCEAKTIASASRMRWPSAYQDCQWRGLKEQA